MASNALTLHVKQMTGEYIAVEINRDSKWPSYDIKCVIERANPDLVRYYQTLLHINPATNEPYDQPTAYHEESILLLLMSPAEVYIKHQEIYKHYRPGSRKTITSIRYSIHVYQDKKQQDTFSFLVNPMGVYLFTPRETHGFKSWSELIYGKSLAYSDTLEQAISSLPEMIRDEVIRKWNAKEILSYEENLPYTDGPSWADSYEEDQ